jgi:hypothetical protein
MQEMTTSDLDRLRVCEAKINNGKQTFIEVGNALLEIRQNKLWRAAQAPIGEADYCNFADYAQRVFGFSKSTASRFISGTKMAEQFPVVNEAQARELKRVPEDKRDAVIDAVSASGDITANAIRETAEELGVMPEPPEQETDPFIDNLTVIAAETTGRADVRRWLEDVALWHVKAFDEATAIMATIVDYYKRGEAIGTARLENAIKALEQ